eukprot:CAMPEP_0201670580 /NCGR_PEP_ID=MMETSP0494-20130426/27198_1 /ASSEMBLY_ACC=CAM_ASM_000839 /TAXON_ID=420259 /ORGANISM="Thalassiosira gravida, Strain GMp14c1" /LENGTH=77 /DNA_ID=CAMNT_0048151675 /DNA_START=68 /DNA_END=301 /DNA_ORIENTATION=-
MAAPWPTGDAGASVGVAKKHLLLHSPPLMGQHEPYSFLFLEVVVHVVDDCSSAWASPQLLPAWCNPIDPKPIDIEIG